MQGFHKRDELIRQRRTKLMTQYEVARKIGVSQSQYSNFENGYCDPTPEQAQALVQMFKLPTDYFRIIATRS